MRILVLSDSHGSSYNILAAIEQQPSADLIIFLGDGERDFDLFCKDKPCIAVRGNCDWGSNLPAFAVTQEGGYTIYCTHGYAENVKYGDSVLIERAREHNAHIALYGHTHSPVTDYEDGLWLVNPGSIREGCYAYVDLTTKGIMPVLMKIR